MADRALRKWVQASVAKYFKDIAAGETPAIPSLADGLETRSDAFMEQQHRAEIRVNGPYTKRFSGCGMARVFINILVSSMMDGQETNIYKLDELLGVFHEAADADIPIFRYGSDAEDNGTLYGCLKLISGKNDYLRVVTFGQLQDNTRLRQGMVAGTYELYVDTL